MNTEALALDTVLEEGREFGPGADRWDIYEQRTIRADVRRVFHAVSMPEYREAWVCSPNADNRTCVVASQGDATYQIELYRAERLEASIAGLIRKWELQEMVFTWQRKPGTGSAETIVCIRLRDIAEGSCLDLAHSGFTSAADMGWHKQFWDASLEKLAWLLEGIPRLSRSNSLPRATRRV